VHEPHRRLARRVGDDVELDRLIGHARERSLDRSGEPRSAVFCFATAV
jgi:hypothetical protein